MKELDRVEHEELFRLWDELSDFGLNQIDAASLHCMNRICGLIGASNSFWVGVVRMCGEQEAQQDPLHGWRIRGVNYMNDLYFDPLHRPAPRRGNTSSTDASEHGQRVTATGGTLSYRLNSDEFDPGMTNIRLVETTGQFRAFRLHAGLLVDLASFGKSKHYARFYAKPGISDRIWVAFPVGPDAESVFVFDKLVGQGEFSDDDMALAALALRGIKWFHRNMLLSHGLGICQEAITPAEHRVKRELLAGATEHEIALQLKLSPGTVHQYATRIYRKFGVQGRAEFMSLWLSGTPGNRN